MHFPYISFGSLHKVHKASEGHESSLHRVAIVEQGQVEDTNIGVRLNLLLIGRRLSLRLTASLIRSKACAFRKALLIT